MPISVHLEDERGNSRAILESPSWLTNWMLRCADLRNTACLRFIDPYGDTLFNRAQIRALIEELAALESVVSEEIVEREYNKWLSRRASNPAIGSVAKRYPKPSKTAICEHITAPKNFASDGLRTPHLYLRFVGD